MENCFRKKNINNQSTFTIADVDSGDKVGISEPDAGDCIYTPACEEACTFVRQGRVKHADIFTMASQSTEFTLINRAKMNKLTVKKILADPGYGYFSGWTGECGLR